MNCDEFRAQRVAGTDAPEMDAHLAECAACRSQLDSLDAAHEALVDRATWEEPSPELRNQVATLITSAPGAPAEMASPWRRWFRTAAAAAVVVLIIGLAAWLRPTPPHWEVAMPGTDLAPNATSTVAGWNTDRGTRMVLTVRGLDPAPEGFFYEMWLSDGPVHISAGTFTGSGEIELWTGVSRGDFPRLWVTLEPIDENESPTDSTVLDTEPPA